MIVLSDRWVLMSRRELEELLRDLKTFVSPLAFDEKVERLWAAAVEGGEINRGEG